ncbi:hypothetical protein [uncultured Paraglaciecola sp.]|uniref:hypothetical protein n=1 Tax=uncultured Paraglaciecola sp. TaxID=1765024 RepID=UPI00260E52B9|nr:hypothetical protein [uncultured Paraglaciecola sp.]
MKQIILATLLLLMFSSVAFGGFSTPPWQPSPGEASQQSQDGFELYYSNLKNLELEIAGTGQGSLRDIPGESDPVWCFTGIPMYDKKSGMLVGYAEDCLAGVTADDAGNVSVLPGYTYLRFFAPGGETWELSVSGNISVLPTVVQTETQWGLPVTHITGSSKRSTLSNGIVSGTGPFKNARGQGRISGMVNMSNFNPDDVEGSTIDFSCFFSIVDLTLSSFSIRDAAETL